MKEREREYRYLAYRYLLQTKKTYKYKRKKRALYKPYKTHTSKQNSPHPYSPAYHADPTRPKPSISTPHTPLPPISQTRERRSGKGRCRCTTYKPRKMNPIRMNLSARCTLYFERVEVWVFGGVGWDEGCYSMSLLGICSCRGVIVVVTGEGVVWGDGSNGTQLTPQVRR